MRTDKDSFYLGIDAGGTKCELMIADVNLKKIYESKFKSLHYSIVGAKVIAEKFSALIKTVLKKNKLDIKNCKGICIGLAGARENADRKSLKKEFSKRLKFDKIRIETDTMTGLYGAFNGADGLILISGTGSVLFGKSGEKIYRVGGWGRILGDEGSGYWIGLQALKNAVKEYDLLQKPQSSQRKTKPLPKKSLLARSLEKKYALNEINIVEQVFHGNFPIQNVAPLVLKLAGKKDKVCLKIVNDAIDGLLHHLETFLKVARRKKSIDVAFIGSIIETDNPLSKKFKQRIKKELPLINVVKKKNPPVYGAIILASKF
ncbi:MAG TPA: BadF/BadG/BcrA/BcrD ATPase family protein [Ignavibacteria bacterium]|nr:BadF/BadG/BcrA/BcrD ATPase family protein [Ignavibacteria bacterium]